MLWCQLKTPSSQPNCYRWTRGGAVIDTKGVCTHWQVYRLDNSEPKSNQAIIAVRYVLCGCVSVRTTYLTERIRYSISRAIHAKQLVANIHLNEMLLSHDHSLSVRAWRWETGQECLAVKEFPR
jgi:hypothetical protein